MNRSFEVLKDVYKPYRYTILGKVTVLETTSGTFVVKPKEKRDIREIYDYLKSRNFSYFPPLVDDSREGVHVFLYVSEISLPMEQKAQDMIDHIALLHQKTTYFKTVSSDTYQEIYEAILSNVVYLKDYYEGLFDYAFSQTYMSPSYYFFTRNYSKILSSLLFVQNELDLWFSSVKEEKKQRVCFIHNNLSLDHYISGDQGYFISFDQSKIDSPVLDLVQFYQKEYFDLDFSSLFSRYQEKFPWNEQEKKLFFILVSLPKKVTLSNDEFSNCHELRDCLDYLYKTEELVGPYYSVE